MALTNKTSLNGLSIGDYVWCRYTASSGAVGSFSDIATKTDATLPSTGVTLDPSAKGSALTLSNGNLQVGGSTAHGHVRATTSYSTGAYYWEVTVLNSTTSSCILGIAQGNSNLEQYLGQTAGSSTGFEYNGNKTGNGTLVTLNTWVNFNVANKVVGFLLEPNTGSPDYGRLTIYVDGLARSVIKSIAASMTTPFYPAVSHYDMNTLVNFGATAFTYTIPNGATSVYDSVPKSMIPTASTATPDGYFKFICAGEDFLGRKKLIADRNVQHSIAWDTLNIAGISTKSGVNPNEVNSYNVRLPNPDVLPTSTGYGRSVAFSPNGDYTAIAQSGTPYVLIYKRSGDTFTKLPNPTTLPTGQGLGVAFSSDGVYMAVAHDTTPFVTIYKRSGDTFTKLSNPATLPTGIGWQVTFSPDTTYMVVSHGASPYLTIYKRSGDTFTKLDNPATLPTASGYGCVFSPDNVYLAINHDVSPYVTIYKRSGDIFTKLANPSTLPTGAGYGVAFSPNGLYLAVTHAVSPYVTIYKRSGDIFTKLANPSVLPGSVQWCSVCYSPNGSHLVLTHTASPYITMYRVLGDTYTNVPLASIGGVGYGGVAISSDGAYMVVGTSSAPFIQVYKKPTLLNSSYAGSLRLLTGGVSNTDSDNEWNQIIVNSTLNGTITAGDINIWNYTSGLWDWGSTTTATNAQRVLRGNGTSTGYGYFSSADATSSRSFRPVLLLESLVTTQAPTSSSMSVSDSDITTESVTLTGTITDVDEGQQVQYRIKINSTYVYPDGVGSWTTLENPPASINQTFPASSFTMGANTITVEFKDSIATEGTPWTSATITKTNALPTISANTLTSNIHNTNATLSATLTDADGDTIQYRIKINGNSYYPDGSNSWTTLASSPVSVSKTILPSDLNWGSNTITLEYKDSNGNSGITWNPTVSKDNATPTNTLSVDTTDVHNASITLSGNILDSDGDQLQYQILLDGNYHYPSAGDTWTALSGSGTVAINHVFTAEDLNFGTHTILVRYKDQFGQSGTDYSVEVHDTNEAPTFELTSISRTTRHTETVRLIGTITDTDGDTLQYRLLVDGATVYPDAIGSWTTLAGTGTVNVDYTFLANALGTTDKTISLEYRDQFEQVGTTYSQLITYADNPPVIDVLVSNSSSLNTTGTYSSNVTLTGSITEPDGDTVQYRIKINDNWVYPDVGGSWTSLENAPATISQSFSPSAFETGLNTITFYARDNATGSSSRVYTVYKPDWNISFVDSEAPTVPQLGADAYSISPTETLLLRTGLIDPEKGYLKQAILTLKMKTQASGTVKMARVNSEWIADSVTYNSKPVIDTANAVDINFTNTATQTIDITSMAGTYGVAFYTTTGSFSIDYQGNGSSITYYPTTMIQPEDGLGDGITLTWQPVVFGDLHSEVFTWMKLVRSEVSNFSSPIVAFQTTDSGFQSYQDTDVDFSKTYYYRIELMFTGYPTVVSNSVFVETPADLLHRKKWNGTSFDTEFVEGLMFHDDADSYYSTNKGLILTYLDVPLIYAGQNSSPIKVQLQNTFDTEATDILLVSDVTSMPFGASVLFSHTQSPFEDLEYMTFDSLASMSNQVFWIRLGSSVFSVGSGTFDIRVKGTILG